jgi:DNA (cytosine-5)-methyltransferase 1
VVHVLLALEGGGVTRFFVQTDLFAGLIVDLFAGGGGASTGIEWALGRSPDLGLNHDLDALRVHALNHPYTRHLKEDIREVDPREATGGRPVELLWASPDCRHFSRAKGARPCHPEVRALPWQVVRWARETRPRLVCVENVPEMQTWGPLDDQGVPIPGRVGETWREWVQALRDLGYRVAWWVLTACDFGAPTSRKRLVVVARRDGEPVAPEPTHGPGRPQPHRTAAECIDWSDLGESIFDRVTGETRHATATLRRIAKGVVRFVLEAKQPFIVLCNHGDKAAGGDFRGQALTEPFQTITAAHDARGLVVPSLVQIGYGERAGQAPRVLDIRQPLGTIVAGGAKHALVAAFLAKHYGRQTGHGPDRPIGTITSVDHHSLVAAHLTHFNQNSVGDDPRRPLKTVMAGAARHGLVAAFLSTYYGQSVGQRVDAPMGTQTTRDRHGLVTVDIDGVTHVVTDIRMRMLQPPELKLGQGFPAKYRLEGTKRTQVRLIGNSVPPQMAEAVVRANCASPRAAVA